MNRRATIMIEYSIVLLLTFILLGVFMWVLPQLVLQMVKVVVEKGTADIIRQIAHEEVCKVVGC